MTDLRWLTGLILAPHELLHVWGYHLIGKPCSYRLGDTRVLPLGSLTRSEWLFVLLWPWAIKLPIALGLLLGWLAVTVTSPMAPGETARDWLAGLPVWSWLLLGGSFLVASYAGVGCRDILAAWHLMQGGQLQAVPKQVEER